MHYLNMALIDKASLLMVPSTYEAGTLYNVLPSGNRAPDSTDQNSGYDQTRADFTFDRGSNAAATRIGSDGLIKKYRENLLLQSNQFDTTWANVNSSETSGQSGYDGSSNAWLLTLTGGTATKLITQSTSTLSGVYNTSFYAKAGTHSIVQIGTSTQSNIFVCFDLSNGSVGSLSSNAIDAKATSIVNGWYRIEVTFLATNATGISIAGVDSISATRFQSTSSNGNFYIQNAQLESGMVSTEYLESTSVTGKAGVLIDLPRINYDANGENGSLLLEPSRANLVQFSEYFDAWSKVNGGTGSNPVLDFGYTSPEGKDNAYKVTFDKGVGTTASDLSILQTSFTSGSNTASFYVKADAATRLMFRNSGTWAIYDIGTEWTRIEKTDTGGSLQIGLREGYGLSDVPDSCSVYLYGAQVESSATYATSYIPNHGESGGVTRAADSCSVTGVSDVIGQSEGTIYWEGYIDVSKSSYGYFPRLITTSSTSANWMGLLLTQSNELRAQYVVGNSSDVQIKHQISTSGNYKIAFAYNDNDFNCFVNGVSVGTNTSVATTIALNDIYLGMENGANLAPTSQDTKKAVLFNERLSNAELATLTTL
jgi:hypothetical protein